MKKIIAIVLLVLSICLVFFFPKQKVGDNTLVTSRPTPGVIKDTPIQAQALFVPYWTIDSIDTGYDEYVYFGIAPDEKGINTLDPGYKNLDSFVLAVKGKKTLLTLRMLDTQFTEKVLQDESMQNSIIQDTIDVARTYGFDGIVLDVEYSGLAFPSVTTSLTNFSVRFAREIKSQHFLFYQAFYGDTYYLARPYNVTDIAKNADGVFVMSYDFHKANGTPGPNFPLSKRDDSDYTFEQMLIDFSKDVSKEKLTIIFGMFGYDWTVDEKNRSIGQAKSLSVNDVQKQFLTKCLFKDCKIIRDGQTQEPFATYTDYKGQMHTVWWEDTKSIEKKKDVIRRNGISRIGFWANGYF